MTENYTPKIEAVTAEQPLGSIAVTGAQELAPAKLFGAEKLDLYNMAPDIDQLTSAMKDYVVAVSQQEYGASGKPIASPGKSRISQAGLRLEKQLQRKIVLAGASFVNSHDDLDQGLEQTRALFPEAIEVGSLEGIYDNRIVPAARALRSLRDASWEAIDNLTEQLDGDEESKVINRYNLFKAVAREEVPGEDQLGLADNFDEMSPVVPLAAIANLASEIPRQIITEARTGAFDSFIALDILKFAHHNPGSGQSEIEKVGQLLPFVDAYNLVMGGQVNRDEICKALALTVDSWPPDRRQIVVEERNKLVERLSANLLKLYNALNANGFIGQDTQDARDLFYESVENYSNEYIKRMQVHNVSNKATLVAVRAQAGTHKKRSKTTQTKAQKRRRAQAESVRKSRLQELQNLWGEEYEPEPLKLVQYDSKNNIFSDSVEPMINEYMESLSQQGNQQLRQDLRSMFEYMRVPDRPVDQPDGVGHIKIISRLEIGDGQYRLFRLKPTEASGLPLHDEHSRKTRIYFSNLDSKTRCIVGIGSRPNHEKFLDDLLRNGIK